MEVAASCPKRYSLLPSPSLSLFLSLSFPFLPPFSLLPSLLPDVPPHSSRTPQFAVQLSFFSPLPTPSATIPIRASRSGEHAGQGWNREGRREWREFTSKAKYNKSCRHCWITLQREFCRRVGGGLTVRRESVSLYPTDSVEPGTTPVSLLPGGSGMEVGDTRRMPR